LKDESLIQNCENSDLLLVHELEGQMALAGGQSVI